MLPLKHCSRSTPGPVTTGASSLGDAACASDAQPAREERGALACCWAVPQNQYSCCGAFPELARELPGFLGPRCSSCVVCVQRMRGVLRTSYATQRPPVAGAAGAARRMSRLAAARALLHAGVPPTWPMTSSTRNKSSRARRRALRAARLPGCGERTEVLLVFSWRGFRRKK